MCIGRTRPRPVWKFVVSSMCAAVLTQGNGQAVIRAEELPNSSLIVKPDLFQPLTEPPCSYCSTQQRKNLIRHDDRVVTWLRGAHNGGAIPLRHFLAGPRVINDTYGLFFYDPDGDYVAAYEKDYGYQFHGWQRGVMIVRGSDGTLWSALSGKALAGPQNGKQLTRIPSATMTWGHWLMLHPESTAYDLFDGDRYQITSLPTRMSDDARTSMGQVDGRLRPLAIVLGLELGSVTKAYPLDETVERACFGDDVAHESVAVFWYGLTRTAVAFSSVVEGQQLTFYADKVSPETAPFKDRQTGSRWTLAGRAVDGPLRGKELRWLNSIQSRWYAWASTNPETLVYELK